MKYKILFVEDEPSLAMIVKDSMEMEGFEVIHCADGEDGLQKYVQQQPDLIILDIGMPEMDGLEVCRAVRKESQVPILFLTAQGDEIDRVVGLELGADDYVAKPFSPRELIARVRAILKRSAPGTVTTKTLRRGVLMLDPDRHACLVKEAPVTLTAREMELLAKLMTRPEHVMGRPQLVDAIYGTNVHVSDRTMDSHLRNLRAKLSSAGCADAIETVHGVGIRMGACSGA